MLATLASLRVCVYVCYGCYLAGQRGRNLRNVVGFQILCFCQYFLKADIEHERFLSAVKTPATGTTPLTVCVCVCARVCLPFFV